MSTGLVDWIDVTGSEGKSKGDNNELRFLRMKAGNTYRVRPLGKPIELWCYWNEKDGRNRRAICGDPDTCPIQNKYDIKPQLRYAINVLDREDGLVKIMEAPPSVFAELKEWAVGAKANPGGKDGGDFQIKVTKNKTMTRYSTNFLKQVEITPEEKTQIESMGGVYPLDKIYKPHTIDEMEQRLFDIAPETDGTEENNVFGVDGTDDSDVSTDVESGDASSNDDNEYDF